MERGEKWPMRLMRQLTSVMVAVMQHTLTSRAVSGGLRVTLEFTRGVCKVG